MGKIVPKLNLNKTPQNTEDNSLIYAKNIRLLKDGSIAPDIAWTELMHEVIPQEDAGIKGYIVGVNNKIYLFVAKLTTVYPITYDGIKIIEYDEVTKEFRVIKSGWTYSGGKITGYTTINNTNEIILTICEYFDNDIEVKIPIKHINLSQCSENDDESIYTQTPNIPITNLTLVGTYTKNIPNGVYQFFIRYRIREEFYTNWFPCSKECFSGTPKITNTIKGSLKYIDTNKDSSKSFVFDVEHLLPENESNFKDYQIGFIISNDDATVARSWKSFSFDVKTIYFDYEQTAIQNENVDDMIKVTYELFNVHNVTYFRNKLYISNYKETNFNEERPSEVDSVGITLKAIPVQYYEQSGDNIVTITVGDKQLEKVNGVTEYYNRWGGGYIKSIFDSEQFNRISYNDTSGVCDYSDLFTFEILWDLSVNPDLIWIFSGDVDNNFVALNTSHENSINRLDFTAPNPSNFTDVSNNYFNWYTWEDVVDSLKHPFSYFVGYRYKWYLASPDNKQGRNIGNGYSDRFTIHDLGFGNTTILTSRIKEWEEQIIECTKLDVLPTVVIHNIHSEINSNDVYIAGSATTTTENNNATFFKGVKAFYEETTEDVIKNYVKDCVKNRIIGIKNTSGTLNYVVEVNDSPEIIQNYVFLYSTYEYKYIDNANVAGSGTATGVTGSFKVQVKRTVHSVVATPTIDATIRVDTTLEKYQDVQYNTLMPFTEYEFYIHYVKQNGVATNGYIIRNGNNNTFSYNNIQSTVYNDKDKPAVIYPVFSNISIPNGYVSCFISVAKVGSDVAKLFKNICTNATSKTFVANCLEADALLYGVTNNIDIINNAGEIVGQGIYYPSGTTDSSKLEYFGDAGVIEWTYTKNDSSSFTANTEYEDYWIKINGKIIKDTNKELIKVTPYLQATTLFDNYGILNTPGYLTMVYKLLRHVDDNDYYYSGNEVYDISVNGTRINLSDHSGGTNINLSSKFYLLSNFNLNYLSITEDLIPTVRTYTASDNITEKEFVIGTQSLTASGIYELKSMYRDYIRKYYSISKNNYISEFNNTIRSSDTNVDEQYRNIYRFEATDYYHVPTNRGKIVLLFSVINNIFVHCEHSLFKFTGANNIQSVEGEIALKEGNVFDTGITEIFDSQYGYAGLQKKEHALVTFDNYIFYDNLAKTIYIYGGNSQLVPISDSIQQLFISFNVTDVIFVADIRNDRFFMNLKTTTGNICLTYNYRAKSIISVHDIDFDIAFNSRSKVYMCRHFRYGESNNITNSYVIYTDNQDNINSYGKLYMFSSALYCADMNYPFPDALHGIFYTDEQDNYEVESCVDIVYKGDYEKVKALDYINWICSKLIKYTEDNNLYLAEQDIKDKYPCDKLRIYSDECSTALLDFVNHTLGTESGKPLIANNYNIAQDGSYKYPRYNCGVWTLNYFRDIRTNNDYFHYETAGVTKDKSLIYGKYFVVRFIFKGKNFKLENVTINASDYGKV